MAYAKDRDASTASPARDRGGDPAVPLNVWPVAQNSPQGQRAGRYPVENREHPGKMLPALARRIVAEFSTPGSLVLDPMAGSGTTLVEGATLGRLCVGVELEPRWAELARTNLAHVLTPDERARTEIREGDARALPHVLPDRVGCVDLVATSPPYAATAQAIDKPGWRAGGSLGMADGRDYSPGAANVGRARGRRYRDAMAAVYAGCYRLLRPGGLLVTVTKNTREGGRLQDLAGLTVELARHAGFRYCAHIVALHAGIRDGALVARPSFWHVLNRRRTDESAPLSHLVVHEDVCVFRKPVSVASEQEDVDRG